MPRVNKFTTHSKTSGQNIRALIKLFALGLNAVQNTELTGLNGKTVNRLVDYDEGMALLPAIHARVGLSHLDMGDRLAEAPA